MPEDAKPKKKRTVREATAIELASRTEHRLRGRVIRALDGLTPARAIRLLEDVLELHRQGPSQKPLALGDQS